MRIVVAGAVCALLAGCSANVPDSGAGGVGFEDYDGYSSAQARRDAELAGTVIPGPRISQESVMSGPSVPTGGNAVTLPGAQNQTGAPLKPPVRNTAGISDEQDFTAVSGRESIESDRQRLEAQRQNYQIVQPTALPTRRGNAGPSIAEFALSTTNQVGQKVHSRSGLSGANRFNRNCAKYPSPDLAQIAFLENGGPERDRFGIDPDGDGFACYWNPAPFRQAKSN